MPNEQSTAAAAFARALREVYERADSPVYRAIVRQGLNQRPPVKLTAASLGDWLHHLPQYRDPLSIRMAHFFETINAPIAFSGCRPS